ncbi:MAG: hypothetical protein HC799_13020 [Limnothrix sp. RL_2_0]|nr:hypothetical protein [Limnothrix sp. RL_2_0]
MASEISSKMQALIEELISLRQTAIDACFNQPQPSGFSFFATKPSTTIEDAIHALCTIHKYFTGNIFNQGSSQKAAIIDLLIAGDYRAQLIEVFYRVTAKAKKPYKQELIDLQKIFGLRSDVLCFKSQK